MPKSKETVDFHVLIDQLFKESNIVTGKALAIWGGEFIAGSFEAAGEMLPGTVKYLQDFTTQVKSVAAFFEAWSLEHRGMPWRIWEQIDKIVLEKDSLPDKYDLLERGRAFGPGGDLSLRRDGNTFRWRFVGPAGCKPPANVKLRKFWDEAGEGFDMRLSKEKVLLWGEERKLQDGSRRWAEDRVAGYVLRYPGMEGCRRVSIQYNEYSYAGQVQFVWFTGLEDWRADGEKGNDI